MAAQRSPVTVIFCAVLFLRMQWCLNILLRFVFTPNGAVLFTDVSTQPLSFRVKQNSLLKIGINGSFIQAPFIECNFLQDWVLCSHTHPISVDNSRQIDSLRKALQQWRTFHTATAVWVGTLTFCYALVFELSLRSTWLDMFWLFSKNQLVPVQKLFGTNNAIL